MSDLSFNWFCLLENLQSGYFLMTLSIKNSGYAFLIRLDLMFSISSWKEFQLLQTLNDLSIRHLKLVSTIFYQIFIVHYMIALQNLWKIFFISSEKLFLFLRYSNFCIFPLFFLSTIALEVDPRKILKFMTPSTA